MANFVSNGTAARLKRHVATSRTSGVGGRVRRRVPSGGSISRFYKAAEDFAPTRDWFWANPCDRAGTITDATSFVQIYRWNALLANMRAGYKLLTTVADGEIVPIPGDCISTTCSGGSVTADNPPSGTVGTFYTYSFTTSGLSSSATATNLPPGLTLSGTTISGTPTTAGQYYVVITGPRTVGSTNCNITRVALITIAEAE